MSQRMSIGVAKALELVKMGWNVRRAATEAGVWPSSVYIAAKRMGIPLQKEDSGVTAQTHTLYWQPGTDQLVVAQHGQGPRSLPGARWYCEGASNSEYQEATFEARKKLLFILAMHIIIRDKCPPEAVHKALRQFLEYRDGLSDELLED
jgi:hypothetical protein